MQPTNTTMQSQPSGFTHPRDDSREMSEVREDAGGGAGAHGLPALGGVRGNGGRAAKNGAAGARARGPTPMDDTVDEGEEEEEEAKGTVGMDVEDELAEMADALLLLHESAC